MLIGYARVSTQDQKLDLQIDRLKEVGCDDIFSDTASGAKTERPGLHDCLKFLRKGDTLVVWKLDRLGRSLPHLVSLIGELQDRGVEFRSLSESIDTSTAGGKLIFHIFSSLAEFERELIRERTNAGLKAARARGRVGGRPRKKDLKAIERMKELYDSGATVKEICDMYGIGRSTFYKYLGELMGR